MTSAQLERQMKAARQLRAETVARGAAHALAGLTGVVHRVVERLRGVHDMAIPSWRDRRGPPPIGAR